jgi:antitoxin MazE
MISRTVRIGKAHGLRIPKPMLEQAGLAGEVNLDVNEGTIIIRSAEKPRAGWAKAFREMAERDDARLLDPETPTAWDEDEWEWE